MRASVEYDGTEFNGFQVQADGRTVQGVLQAALAKLLGETVSVIGAGRTDAGVHATGQVISFRTASALPEATIARGVNALLPADVAARDVEEVDDRFHARYSATSRTYNYRIWNAREPRPLLRRRTLWVDDPLDVATMERASRHLVGRHDFSAFSMKAAGSRERTVRRATWRREGPALSFEVEADAFLRGMVRGIVGTLLRVGRGRLDAEGLREALRGADRSLGGPAAPPHGLCLVRVEYADIDGKAERGNVMEEDEA